MGVPPAVRYGYCRRKLSSQPGTGPGPPMAAKLTRYREEEGNYR